ncbi:multiubiquitin domain-containing protein [Streptomyces sp. NPDC057939]|uniref:multiubiquitin domain-containing protein n=1 Tax=Streptomyces sp. NPDC057939 TaxID=3346284 RepID=UPI0036ED7E68
MTEPTTVPSPSARRISVFVDGHEYDIARRRATPAQLRRLPDPDIPGGTTIWLDIPDAPDRRLTEDEPVDLQDGMRFFSDPQRITILIDRHRYEVIRKRMTGQEIRALPESPIPDDRDLWLDVVDQHDRKIDADAVVRLHDGMRFFTAPGSINPGDDGVPR